MDYRDLVFLSVASNLNISRAAEELHISQPAVSKHIKELENTLGVALLERKGNRISLTKAGEKAVRHLKMIKLQYSEMEFELARTTGGFKGLLSVGASSTIAQYVLPSVLGDFNKKYPGIKISMLNGNSHEIEELLKESEVDIALVENESSDSSLKYISLMKDKIIAVTGVNSVYASTKDLSCLSLCEIPLILRERGSGTLEVLLRALQKKGISPDRLNIFMNLGTTEAIKNMLFNFDGIAFVSEWAVKRELEDKRLKELFVKGLNIEREFRLVYKKGPLLKIPSLFHEFLKDYLR